MTLPSVREVRILDAQQIDVFDIDSVRARPGADAVLSKSLLRIATVVPGAPPKTPV